MIARLVPLLLLAAARSRRRVPRGRGELALGTDSGFRYLLPGYSLHEELRATVAAGIPVYDALRMATSAAAECLGRLHEFGTVEPGNTADLLLLEENPLDDVANAARRVGVMAAGRWWPEWRLKERLEEIAASYGN